MTNRTGVIRFNCRKICDSCLGGVTNRTGVILGESRSHGAVGLGGVTNRTGVILSDRLQGHSGRLGGVTNRTGVIPLFVISVRPDSVSRNANYVRLVMEMLGCRLRPFHSVPTKSSKERGKHI